MSKENNCIKIIKTPTFRRKTLNGAEKMSNLDDAFEVKSVRSMSLCAADTDAQATEVSPSELHASSLITFDNQRETCKTDDDNRLRKEDVVDKADKSLTLKTEREDQSCPIPDNGVVLVNGMNDDVDSDYSSSSLEINGDDNEAAVVNGCLENSEEKSTSEDFLEQVS